ncbi:hypothetical protein [Dokdonella sp.]|uniref:hypothetical protein n=1 Tax=Dokdonella sp. TaxID=2291710 RepID=UPI0026369169|nr:hypothetical protein [Dokdonella sp.]
MSGIRIREAGDGAERAAELFMRRFGHPTPTWGHHVIAFRHDADGGEAPVCYVHFTPVDGILLGGGACVDNRAMRSMTPAERAAIRAGGGLYRLTLDWAVRHFAPTYPAIFGYCGDALAERVDREAGFEPTGHARLLVHWTRDVAPAERERLIAQAHAIGPF